ncbi:MAG: hypothetical protein ACRDD2_00960 [Sarcina sp.]
MKKVLASVIIAAIIVVGGAVYTTTHPEKTVPTPATDGVYSTNGNFGSKQTENINDLSINNYLGNWTTDTVVGSIDNSVTAGKTSHATITINNNKFESNDVFSNNFNNHVLIKNPIYTIYKLPDNYCDVNFNSSAKNLGLSGTDDYQVIINGAPTDVYISNGHLLFNSDGTFFTLKKSN